MFMLDRSRISSGNPKSTRVLPLLWMDGIFRIYLLLVSVRHRPQYGPAIECSPSRGPLLFGTFKVCSLFSYQGSHSHCFAVPLEAAPQLPSQILALPDLGKVI